MLVHPSKLFLVYYQTFIYQFILFIVSMFCVLCEDAAGDAAPPRYAAFSLFQLAFF